MEQVSRGKLRLRLGAFFGWIAALYGQDPVDFAAKVRAAMAPSLAQQRASIRKQAASAVKTTASPPEPFFTTKFPRNAVPLADCDPLPADQLDNLIKDSATKEDVDADLVHAVVDEESAARPCAVSFRGAQGLMQLMPATAAQFDVRDPFDPKQNIEAGTKLLKFLLKKYDNDVALALGAYNAGPGRVDQEGGIPPIPETLNYVSDILRKLRVPEDKPARPQE